MLADTLLIATLKELQTLVFVLVLADDVVSLSSSSLKDLTSSLSLSISESPSVIEILTDPVLLSALRFRNIFQFVSRRTVQLFQSGIQCLNTLYNIRGVERTLKNRIQTIQRPR